MDETSLSAQGGYAFRGVDFPQGLRVPLTNNELKRLLLRRSKSNRRFELLSGISLRWFSVANDYIDRLYARGLSENTIYDEVLEIMRLTEDIAATGADPLRPNRSVHESYMAMIAAANAESSTAIARNRIHRWYMFLRSRGILAQLPYDTRIDPARVGNRFQQREVPATRGRPQRKKRLLLPSHSMIDRVIEELVPEARLPARIARQAGARISEALRVLEAWHTRKADCNGVTTLNLKVKGGYIGCLHFDPNIANEITECHRNHQQFVRADGVPWTRLTLSAEIRRAADAVGASELTFHTLRHVFASRAFQVLHRDAKNDPRLAELDPVLIVQYLLNHASPQTTMDTYLHNFAFEPGDMIPSAEMHAVRNLCKAVPDSMSRAEIQQ